MPNVAVLLSFGIQTSCPGNSSSWSQHFEPNIQSGLEVQIVHLQIGVIGSIFIIKMRQNDNGVQNISGWNNYLLQLLHGIFVGRLFPFIVMEYLLFWLLATILQQFQNPTTDLHIMNMRLASLCECIEHIFWGIIVINLEYSGHTTDCICLIGLVTFIKCAWFLFYTQLFLLP